MSKAQSISLNTIVIALIAILVLVILVAILGTNTRNFAEATKNCLNTGGGKCVTGDLTQDTQTNICATEGAASGKDMIPHPTIKQCSDTEVCCIIVSDMLSGS